MKFGKFLGRSKKGNRPVRFYSPNEADVKINGTTYMVEAAGMRNLMKANWDDEVDIQDEHQREAPKRVRESIEKLVKQNWIY